MHELSICYALLDQIERIAAERRACAVSQIVLGIGPLAGVEPELLRNAYPLAAAGTVAEGAELLIETSDVVVSCTRCGEESTVPANRLLCASCGDFRTRLVAGDDMVLKRVELDVEAAEDTPPATAIAGAGCGRP